MYIGIRDILLISCCCYSRCLVLVMFYCSASCMPVEFDQWARGNPQRDPDALQPEGAHRRRRLAGRGRKPRRDRTPADHGYGRTAEEASSPETARRTSASTGRSTPIAGASMAASIASPGRPMPSTTCRPASISKAGCSPSRTLPSCFMPLCRSPAIRSLRSRSAPTPILTSRSRSIGGLPARSSNCCWKPGTPSPSRRNPIASFGTSTSSGPPHGWELRPWRFP